MKRKLCTSKIFFAIPHVKLRLKIQNKLYKDQTYV